MKILVLIEAAVGWGQCVRVRVRAGVGGYCRAGSLAFGWGAVSTPQLLRGALLSVGERAGWSVWWRQGALCGSWGLR